MIALAGGAIGVVLAAWGIRAVGAAAPPFMGLDSALRIDGTVLAFALGLSLLTGLAFGLVPAVVGSKADLTTVLKGASSAGGARTSGRILSALVVVEVSLALVLLVGGGLAYTIGIPVLMFRRPDPWPRAFGYHEVWHSFTVVAAVLHFAVIATVVS